MSKCALGAALVVLAIAVPQRARADPAEEAARVQAAFLAAHGDRPIASIDVAGLARTRPAVVWQWIRCKEGTPLSQCDLARIVERLDRLQIFSGIQVQLDDEPAGAAVIFELEEKWTLYPVPMLWYSPGTELAGLVIVEANLLGFNKGLAVGGVYSNRGWYTLAGYNDPNIGFSDAWGSLHGFLGRSTVENDAPDGSIEQSFDLRRFDLEWSLGWTFWDRLSPTWNGAVRVARIGALHVPGPELPQSETVTTQALQLIYSDRRVQGLFEQGLRVAGELTHGFPLDDRSAHYDVAIFDAKYTRPAPLDGSAEAVARVCLGDFPVAFEERLGGLEGSRTLNGSGLVAADRNLALSMSYQVPVLTVAPGTLTAVLFGEAGRYARNAEPWVGYGGPGLGLRAYLKRVAIPAVGVDAGYELASRRLNFSIAIGYRPTR